jgi:NAD(P)-dependent dehydrogenase (short-subunit alcohol dehydrogenase family)
MTDKIAIVTGGRRGIGAGIAIELAKAGFHVLIADIERDAAAPAGDDGNLVCHG